MDSNATETPDHTHQPGPSPLPPLLQRPSRVIALAALTGLALGLIATLVRPPTYRSTVSILLAPTAEPAIDMATEADAQKAIAMFNEVEYEGRKLSVCLARPETQSSPNAG